MNIPTNPNRELSTQSSPAPERPSPLYLNSAHSGATANGHTTTQNNVINYYAGILDSSTPALPAFNPEASNPQTRTPSPTPHGILNPQLHGEIVSNLSRRTPSPVQAQSPMSYGTLGVPSPKTHNRKPSRRIRCGRVLVISMVVLLVGTGFAGCTALIFTRDPLIIQTPAVYHGFWKGWTNAERSGVWGWQITVSDLQAWYLSAVAFALCILSIKSAYIVINRLALNLLCWASKISCDIKIESEPPASRSRLNSSATNHPEPSEHSFLLQDSYQHDTSQFRSQIRTIWRESKSPRCAIMGFLRVASKPLAERLDGEDRVAHWLKFSGKFLGLVFLSMLSLVVFFSLAFGSIYSLKIVTDNSVLSESPQCGFWVRNPSSQGSSKLGLDYLQEVEASEYAKECFHVILGVNRCDFFTCQKLDYDENPLAPCPFDDDFCIDGRSSTYTSTALSLSTGLVSSRELGINIPIGYTFNRTTTCSPVGRRARLSNDNSTYEYNYGPTSDYGNFTWSSSANHVWEFPGYNVAIFHYKQNITENWYPIPEFRPQINKEITLLLVQSKKNYHMERLHDLIFPANEEIKVPGNPPQWYNNDPISTALACVDTTHICTSNGATCFSDITHPSPELPSHAEEIGYYMLRISLLESAIFNTLQFQGSLALIATSKLRRPVLLPLSQEQWKVEVRHLFEASLARIWINLRDYIRGIANGEEGFEDGTLEGMRDMCRMWKFKARGWKNVSVMGMILVVLIVGAVQVLSLEVQSLTVRKVEESWQQHLEMEKKVLIAEWLFEVPFRLLSSDDGLELIESEVEEQEVSHDLEEAEARIFVTDEEGRKSSLEV